MCADHGRFFIADAGGNTVLRANRWGGISVLALFPNRDTPNPFPPPPDGPPLPPIIPMNAVPTGVVKGPDGALYMSQLTGFPFPSGSQRVPDRSADGETSIYASGFTNIMDLDFGKDGTLYVLEMDHDSLLFGTAEGALHTVGWKRRGAAARSRSRPGRSRIPAGSRSASAVTSTSATAPTRPTSERC